MENQFDKAVKENLKRIMYEVNESMIKNNRDFNSLKIMAVTKTVSAQLVNTAIENGIDLLGENRVQEYLSKKDEYNLKKANVHFIGNLQSNKVKYIIDNVDMIESVSSIKLLNEIDKCAKKHNLVKDILLEVNIGREQTKTGFFKEELENAFEIVSKLDNIKLKGFMCIPPKTDSEKFFGEMEKIFIDNQVKKIDNIDMTILSMGMSSDYKLAIKYNSNIIRLGTALFGNRNYAVWLIMKTSLN